MLIGSIKQSCSYGNCFRICCFPSAKIIWQGCEVNIVIIVVVVIIIIIITIIIIIIIIVVGWSGQDFYKRAKRT